MLLMTLSTLALTNSCQGDRSEAGNGRVCQFTIFHDNQAYLPRFSPIENWEDHFQTNYSNNKSNLESRLIPIRGRYSNQNTVPE